MRCLGFPVLVLLVLLSACASSSPGDGGPETQGPPTQDAQGDAAAPDALLPEVTADGSVPDGGPLPDLLPAGCIEDGLECGTLPADGSTLHCGNCPATEWCNGKQACVSALDCANGGFQVVEAWHDQPQPGPAAATLAPPYSLALRWKASNPASCTDCNRAVVVSSPGSPDGGQIACRDLGPVAACPAVSSGWIALTVPEPVPSVATDALFVSLLPPGQSCADDWESFAPGQSHQVVSVAVSLADPDTVCEADPCGAAGATCGLAEDGCGGVIPCGSCPADQVCDGGSCRVAAPC